MPLFYEALNIKRGKNDYYKRFNCKIPFLNGGLFDSLYDWKHTHFNIPNELFSNNTQKGERESNGILDIFDRYNFTMNEDEPLEREVAVDPEMLGKIFENLLDSKDRKSKGAFYTPREIVHYMCQESLINYLVNKTNVPYDDMKSFILDGEFMKDEDFNNRSQLRLPQTVFNNLREIDKALEDIRVADPAVGSGAFPLGMLSEIVKARNIITYYYAYQTDKNYEWARLFEQRNLYDLKRKTIQKCIFGVDIEASAVDIAKLRLWLSLVVDEDLEPTYEEVHTYQITRQRDPQPLPNLDYNIMCGNSLIDEFEGIKLFDDNLVGKSEYDTSGIQYNFQFDLFSDSMEIYLDDLQREQERLFGEQNYDTKREIKKNIDDIIDKVIRAKLERDDNTDGLVKYEEIRKQKTKPYFLWKLEFAKVFRENGGFDIVIANPPYIKEYTNSIIFQKLKNNKYYQGKMDFWYFFACIGIDLLQSNGIQAFIAPNNWITNAGASKLRNKVLTETEIKYFVDFGNYKVFQTASIQTMVYILQKKTKLNNDYSFNYLLLKHDNISLYQLNTFLYSNNKSEYYNKKILSIDPYKFIDKYIVFNDNITSNIINKIKSIISKYLDKSEIAQGIVAPQENLNKSNQEILGNGYVIGEGIFVLSNQEVQNLKIPENEIKIFKPFFTTEELSRYIANTKSRYQLIYAQSDINDIILKYPTIKRHLDRFSDIMTSDNKPYGLHRARDEKFFIGEKIIAARKCLRPTFTYSDFNTYVSQTFNIIKSKNFNLKYLIGILNSRLIEYWLRNMGKMQGNNFQIDKEPLINIPIAIPSINDERKIIVVINKIFAIKQSDSTSDISVLEAEIDRIVYELYGLTDEEIKIVEESI